MRSATIALHCLIVVGLIGCLMSRVAVGDELGQKTNAVDQYETTSLVRDVRLDEGGIVRGQLLDALGQPVGRAYVNVLSGDDLAASTYTDDLGRFEVNGLKGGVYRLESTQGSAVYRFWAPGTAPPRADAAVLLTGGDVVRAQYRQGLFGGGHGQFGGAIMNLLHNPWFVGAGIATAIALPIALDKNDAS